MAKKRSRSLPSEVSADVVRARSFVLVDDRGRSRIEMSCFDSFVQISLNDADGKQRLTLMVNEHSSGICLFDANDAPAISMNVSNDRGPGMSISSDGSSISLGISVGAIDPRGDGPNIDINDFGRSRHWSAVK